MKRLSVFLILSVVFSFFAKAQNVDITTTDSVYTDTLENANVQYVVDNIQLSDKVISDFVYNFSKMLFWESYMPNFVVAATNSRLSHLFSVYFDNRITHGRFFEITVVSQSSFPKANIVYVSVSDYDLLPRIVSYYSNSSTVIVAETQAGLAMGADIALVRTYSPETGQYFSYKYNRNNLKRKNIVISPEFRGYAAQ